MNIWHNASNYNSKFEKCCNRAQSWCVTELRKVVRTKKCPVVIKTIFSMFSFHKNCVFYWEKEFFCALTAFLLKGKTKTCFHSTEQFTSEQTLQLLCCGKCVNSNRHNFCELEKNLYLPCELHLKYSCNAKHWNCSIRSRDAHLLHSAILNRIYALNYSINLKANIRSKITNIHSRPLNLIHKPNKIFH